MLTSYTNDVGHSNVLLTEQNQTIPMIISIIYLMLDVMHIRLDFLLQIFQDLKRF